jgi:hypothetical protein
MTIADSDLETIVMSTVLALVDDNAEQATTLEGVPEGRVGVA